MRLLILFLLTIFTLNISASTFYDNYFILGDEGDLTKQLKFSLGGGTTGKSMTITSSPTDNRVLTLPDTTDTLATLTQANAKVADTGDTMTGDLLLDNQSDLRLLEADGNGSNYIGFQAPAAVTGDVVFTLPDGDGAANYALTTNGSGTLSWQKGGGATNNANIMPNPDFEDSDITNIDETDATSARDASTFLNGVYALKCTLNSDTGGCGDTAISTSAAYAGVNMTLKLWVKTTADALDICVYANGAELAGSCQSNKDNNTGYVRYDGNWYEYTFDFVADTTSIGWFVDAPTSGDIFYVDNVSLAPSTNVGEVAQAGFFGSLKWATTTNCQWSRSTASWGNYSADADCDDNARTAVSGLGTVTSVVTAANGEGQIPQIKFSGIPAGTLRCEAKGGFYNANSPEDCGFRFSDGTNSTSSNTIYTAYIANNISGEFHYSTAQGATTIQIQSYSQDASACNIYNQANPYELEISCYHYPPTSKIYQGDDQWKVEGIITDAAGTSVPGGAAAQTSFLEIDDATLTLTAATGSAPVGIACKTGEASVVGNTTCTGNEIYGWTFNRSGQVLCTAKYIASLGTNASGEESAITFELDRTSASSSASVQESNDRSAELSIYQTDATVMAVKNGLVSTGLFDCNGQCTIRLKYEHSITGTPDTPQIIADANANNGQRNFYFICEKYGSKINASFTDVYKIPGSSTGNPVIVSALIAADATISEEDDNFLASCTDADPRVCTTTTSYFKADPKCWATPTVAGNLANVTGDTSTTITIDVTDVSTSFNLFCQGVK